MKHTPDDRVRPPELDLELLEKTVVHDLVATKHESNRVDIIKHWPSASLRNVVVVADEERARSRADVENEEERHAEKLENGLLPLVLADVRPERGLGKVALGKIDARRHQRWREMLEHAVHEHPSPSLLDHCRSAARARISIRLARL